jgi:hypothetical protein
MKWAALIAWVITALGGFGLLGIWLRSGGLAAASRPGARIRPPLIFSHMALAATGLVLWIIYLAADKDAIAWAAVIVLGPVAILGFSMLAIWIQQRTHQPISAGASGVAATAPPAGASGSTVAVSGRGDRPPEQHFPIPVVVLHGLLAVTTLTLAILASAGVGGS